MGGGFFFFGFFRRPPWEKAPFDLAPGTRAEALGTAGQKNPPSSI